MAIARQRIHLPPGAWRRAIAGLVRGDLFEGDAIRQFESAFAEFVGVHDAVAVPSGRAGLNFIYQAMGLEQGSEVICSAFGYPVVPHLTGSLGYDVKFADCEMVTLGMDPDELRKTITDRTKVVLATHLYGIPCRIREIAEIAASNGAILIEDCAHCFGASVDGRKAGAWGGFAYFSFETSKPINTLGGGMVTTSDAEAAKRLREIAAREPTKNFNWLLRRLLKTTFEATVTHPVPFNLGVYPALRFAGRKEPTQSRFASGYQRDEVTMQGRMGRYTNVQAKLGLAQMDQAAIPLARRSAHARRMIDALGGAIPFQTHDEPGVESNFMLVTALSPRMHELSHKLLELGIDSKHHYMRDCSGLNESGPPFPRAAQAEREILHLPAYPELSVAQIGRVIEQVERALAMLGTAENVGQPSVAGPPSAPR